MSEIKTKNNKNIENSKSFDRSEKKFSLKEELNLRSQNYWKNDVSSDEKVIERLKNNPYPEHVANAVLENIDTKGSGSKDDRRKDAYIKLLLDLPYWQKTEDNKSLESIENKLNESHYGLEKVKQEIIEHIAYTRHSKDEKSSTICLVGPPGVGKTTIVKSIAEALGRKFEKIPFGNFNDPEHFKGFDRTYIGAQPGMLIKTMKRAGVINPVILLDEIDKTARSSKGDVADSLLEILDSEQNKVFLDFYLDLPYDVSNVLFIATANFIENISGPLLDRLNIIKIDAYSFKEKVEIITNYTVKKLMKDASFSNDELKFERKAIEYIVNRYTNEAGARQAERLIRKIIRRVIVKKEKNLFKKEIIDINKVQEYLGDEVYDNGKNWKINSPGEALWLTLNKDTRPCTFLIETSFYEGKEIIYMTGSNNLFIYESGMTAYTYIKNNAKNFNLDNNFSAPYNIQLNIIDGNSAIDGKSIGVALTTAILSLLKKIIIPSDILLLGEITLNGHISAVNKIEQKIITANEKGIKTIYLPKENEKELKKIPNEYKKHIEFYCVENYIEIYKKLFNKKS